VGYRVTNQVRITLHDTAKLGAILDKVVSLGANQIDSIEFGVSEPEALKDEARKLALKKVTDNAKLYAGAAGVTLGRSSASPGGKLINLMQAGRPDGDGEGRPIEAGTAAVEVRQVSWEIDWAKDLPLLGRPPFTLAAIFHTSSRGIRACDAATRRSTTLLGVALKRNAVVFEDHHPTPL
jgi:hypothetical protein